MRENLKNSNADFVKLGKVDVMEYSGQEDWLYNGSADNRFQWRAGICYKYLIPVWFNLPYSLRVSRIWLFGLKLDSRTFIWELLKANWGSERWVTLAKFRKLFWKRNYVASYQSPWKTEMRLCFLCCLL